MLGRLHVCGQRPQLSEWNVSAWRMPDFQVTCASWCPLSYKRFQLTHSTVHHFVTRNCLKATWFTVSVRTAMTTAAKNRQPNAAALNACPKTLRSQLSGKPRHS